MLRLKGHGRLTGVEVGVAVKEGESVDIAGAPVSPLISAPRPLDVRWERGMTVACDG